MLLDDLYENKIDFDEMTFYDLDVKLEVEWCSMDPNGPCGTDYGVIDEYNYHIDISDKDILDFFGREEDITQEDYDNFDIDSFKDFIYDRYWDRVKKYVEENKDVDSIQECARWYN